MHYLSWIGVDKCVVVGRVFFKKGISISLRRWPSFPRFFPQNQWEATHLFIPNPSIVCIKYLRTEHNVNLVRMGCGRNSKVSNRQRKEKSQETSVYIFVSCHATLVFNVNSWSAEELMAWRTARVSLVSRFVLFRSSSFLVRACSSEG